MNRLRRSVVLSAVLMIAALPVRVEADRGDIAPISGPVGLLNTSLTSFSSVVVDDANQRVYVVSQQENTILATDFSGNQTAIRTTFAQPTTVTVGGGAAFALLAGTGQVVRLAPTTLAPTVLVGGLVDANGLAYSNGYLYVFARLDNSQQVLHRINATTGASTMTAIVTRNYERFELFAFPLQPDYLYGTAGSGYRWNLVTGATQYAYILQGFVAALPDGQLVNSYANTGQPTGLLSYDPSTIALTGRVWRMSPPDMFAPITWAASRYALAMNRGDLVELVSVDHPADTYRSYRFTDFQTYYGMRLAMSADSSRLFAVMPYGGTIHLYAVPGVGVNSTPSAAKSPSGSARTAAPSAPAANVGRSVARQAVATPPWVMKSVDDIEFASDGAVYASDSSTGVVNRFAPDGTPVTGWRALSGVESLTELSGSMYGVLRREGTIVRIGASVTPTVIASGLKYPTGLTSANGKLWTTDYRQYYASKVVSVDPATGATWFQPDEYWTGYDWEQAHLAESPLAGHLLGYQGYYGLRFDLNTLAFTPDQVYLAPPFAVAPDGLTVIEGSGKRLAANPFALDGFIFPGSGHTISGANPSGRRMVAARSNMLNVAFVVYDETNPGSILYSEPTLQGYQIGRIEFRPGTTELWVTVKFSSTGQAVLVPIDVSPAPYASAVMGDDADVAVNVATVLQTRHLASAIDRAQGSLSAYSAVPAGDLTPDAPSSPSVGPAPTGGLTPAAAQQPDPTQPSPDSVATVPVSATVPGSAPVSAPVPVSVASAAAPTTPTTLTTPSSSATPVVTAQRRVVPTTKSRRRGRTGAKPPARVSTTRGR